MYAPNAMTQTAAVASLGVVVAVVVVGVMKAVRL